MDWSADSPDAKDAKENVAYDVLQTYVHALHDEMMLKNLLADDVVLDYFGEIFHGQNDVAQQILKSLQESNYDVLSVTVSDELVFEALDTSNDNVCVDSGCDVDGVTLISVPKPLYKGLAFTTPPSQNIGPQVPGKRTWKEAALDDLVTNFKSNKIKSNNKDGGNRSLDYQFSPDMHHLMAEGTIRYPKKRISSTDPKRARRSSSTPRDRYCKLHLGFLLDPSRQAAPLAVRCKVCAVKYHVNSRSKPRNLLPSFNNVV